MRPVLVGVLLIASSTSAEAVLEAFSAIQDEQRESIIRRNKDEFDEHMAFARDGNAEMYAANIEVLGAAGRQIEIRLPGISRAFNVISEGLSWKNNRNGQWRGRIVQDALGQTVYAFSGETDNTLTLHVTRWIYDAKADEYSYYPLELDPKEISEWRPGDPFFGPFPISESTSLANSVHGDWEVHTSDDGFKAFRFLTLANDLAMLMIVELDPDKITDGTD